MKQLLLLILVSIPSFSDARVIDHVACLYSRMEDLKVTRIDYADDATVVTFKTTKKCSPT